MPFKDGSSKDILPRDRRNNFPGFFLDVFLMIGKEEKKKEIYLFRFVLFKISYFLQIFGSKNKKLENYFSGFLGRFLI